MGRSSTLSGAATAIPQRDSRRHVAGRFKLRPTRLAATEDLQHLLGISPCRGLTTRGPAVKRLLYRAYP